MERSRQMKRQLNMVLAIAKRITPDEEVKAQVDESQPDETQIALDIGLILLRSRLI